MPFHNNFEGDLTALKIITDNIEKKSLLIDGVTCYGALNINEPGDKCYYYTRSAPSVKYLSTTGDPILAGTPITYSAAGLQRHELALDDCIQISDVLVSLKSPSVDETNDRLKYAGIDAANVHNALAVKYLAQNGTDIQDTEALTEANAYGKLIDIIEDFRLNNKDKGLMPTAVFVSNAAAIFLFKDTRFTRFVVKEAERKYANQIADIGGIPVLEAPDMDDLAGYDFIVLHYSAFVAPMNTSSITTSSAVQLGFPNGQIVGGEIRYGFDIADKGAVLVKKNA